MPQFDTARKAQVAALSSQLSDMITGTDTTPEINPLQAQLDDAINARNLAESQRATAVQARDQLVANLAGSREQLVALHAAIASLLSVLP